MYQTAIELLKKLNKYGYDAYIVGGYVRDVLLHIPSNDIDICTNAKPENIKQLFFIIEDHSDFGSFVIEENHYRFEITTFRCDHYQNSRYPTIAYVDTLKEDLTRRDFTINALCINQKGKVIDLLNGIEDLNNKIIKMIGNPKKRLQEDPLRILRAIRFCAQLDFQLDPSLSNAIYQYKTCLQSLSKNSISKEIQKITQYKEGKKLLKKFQLDNYILSL